MCTVVSNNSSLPPRCTKHVGAQSCVSGSLATELKARFASMHVVAAALGRYFFRRPQMSVCPKLLVARALLLWTDATADLFPLLLTGIGAKRSWFAAFLEDIQLMARHFPPTGSPPRGLCSRDHCDCACVTL